MIVVPVCLTIAIGTAFAFANFSFGYLAGFYLFTMMAGFFWLNAFSVLTYDHEAALISAVASSILFLVPSLMIRSPGWTFPLSHRPLDRIPEGILGFAAVILVVCACDGFRLVGLEGMAKYRDELAHSRLIDYAIGNINGALIPFAFACFLARKRWFMLAAISLVSLLYYPVTLTKISLFTVPFLIFMAIISARLEARTCVIVSLLAPLVIGVAAVAGRDPIDITRTPLIVFSVLNFRLLAIPASSLEHYFAFFRPLTDLLLSDISDQGRYCVPLFGAELSPNFGDGGAGQAAAVMG